MSMKTWYKEEYQVYVYNLYSINFLCHVFWYFVYVRVDLTPSWLVSLPNTALLATTHFVLLLQIYYIPYVIGPTIIGLLWWLKQ